MILPAFCVSFPGSGNNFLSLSQFSPVVNGGQGISAFYTIFTRKKALGKRAFLGKFPF